jgi:signal peptidase I
LEENTKVKENNIKKNGFFKEWVMPVISAIVICLLLNKFVFFNVQVPTGSMIPTINLENRLLVTRIHKLDNIKRGDIIVFYSNELSERLIKRLIGLPGDKIEIKNDAVFVNGEKLEEDYVKNIDKEKYNGTFEVPNGKYFFLGDNRPVSNDARFWKNPYIDGSAIEGKAQFIFYPFGSFGAVK